MRPAPAGLYTSAASDPWWWRVTKSRVRASRRLVRARREAADRLRRLVRRKPLPLSEPVQAVPLRRLACYHLAVRLPDALAPLGRDGLEEMIMRRHRRSGLPLAFEASDNLNPIVRRRLKRTRTPEARQEVLRTTYFDRLHRLSGNSLTLALFYWLRSAELDAEHHRLLIRPVVPLELNFLADFDLELAFTLKAFLDHTTLTLAEHAEIFRTPLDDSQQRFEALSNVLLIEACAGDGGTRASIGPAITEEGRYRLRPLTIHPVTQHLARRHITY